MPYNIPALLLPLIGGYIIINRAIFFRHRYRGINSQRLVFDSFIAGLILFAATYLLREITYFLFPQCVDFCTALVSYFPYHAKLLGTSTASFVLAVGFMFSANSIIRRWFEEYEYNLFYNSIFELGDELEQLFLTTSLKGEPVQITLKNNKVYVGFITEVNEPQKTNYISILPLASGYREPKTKLMELTTPYQEIVEALESDEEDITDGTKQEANSQNAADVFEIEENDFLVQLEEMIVVIKQDEILSANQFNAEIYQRFQDAIQKDSNHKS